MSFVDVVPPGQPGEDRGTRFLSRSEAIAIQHLGFQAREKRLHHRVIEAVSDAAHGDLYARLRASLAESERRVFAAVKCR